HRLRILLLDLAQELVAAHVGHALIGDQHRRRLVAQQLQRRGPRRHRANVKAGAKRLLEHDPVGPLIVDIDDEVILGVHRPPPPSCHPRRTPAASSGSSMWNSVPMRPESDVSSTPPSARMTTTMPIVASPSFLR